MHPSQLDYGGYTRWEIFIENIDFASIHLPRPNLDLGLHDLEIISKSKIKSARYLVPYLLVFGNKPSTKLGPFPLNLMEVSRYPHQGNRS